jgi:hypothetical protein
MSEGDEQSPRRTSGYGRMGIAYGIIPESAVRDKESNSAQKRKKKLKRDTSLTE